MKRDEFGEQLLVTEKAFGEAKWGFSSGASLHCNEVLQGFTVGSENLAYNRSWGLRAYVHLVRYSTNLTIAYEDKLDLEDDNCG